MKESDRESVKRKDWWMRTEMKKNKNEKEQKKNDLHCYMHTHTHTETIFGKKL